MEQYLYKLTPVRQEMLTASRDELITKLRNEATIEKIGSLQSE